MYYDGKKVWAMNRENRLSFSFSLLPLCFEAILSRMLDMNIHKIRGLLSSDLSPPVFLSVYTPDVCLSLLSEDETTRKREDSFLAEKLQRDSPMTT